MASLLFIALVVGAAFQSLQLIRAPGSISDSGLRTFPLFAGQPPKANKTIPTSRPISIVPADHGASAGTTNGIWPRSGSTPSKPYIYAYLDQDPPRELDQVVANLDVIDAVIPKFLKFSQSGDIAEIDAAWQRKAMKAIRSTGQADGVYPIVTESVLGQKQTRALLSSPELAQRAAVKLVGIAQVADFQGFCFDFSATSSHEQGQVLATLSIFRRSLAIRSIAVCVIQPFDADPAWLRRLAATTDLVILTAVNGEASGDEPMPLADQNWFSSSLSGLRSMGELGHTVIAIGSGARDWTSGDAAPTDISYSELARIAGRQRQVPLYDAITLNTRLTYVDDNRRRHRVWALDAANAYNEMLQAAEAGFNHIAIMAPGMADPGVWQILRSNAVQRRNPRAAETLDVRGHVGEEGSGPLFKVVGTEQIGLRRFGIDPSTLLITSQTFEQLPQSYTMVRWGEVGDKRVALTFDDGPDPVSTEQILDVLAKENTPATFFVVGYNAMREPELIARMINEGHTIGNHSFYHGSFADMSKLHFGFEINATQRLIASLTGHYAMFLRPPYGADSPVLLKSTGVMKRLAALSKQGYVIASDTVDPKDWDPNRQSNIGSEVLAGIKATQGGVILLHDAGGDRSHTVAALSPIIRNLKAEGYRFVPLAAFLPEAARIKVTPAPRYETIGDSIAFFVYRWLDRFWTFIFLTVVVLSIARSLAVCALAMARRPHAARVGYGTPTVTVLVPAFNESGVILTTVNSLLRSTNVNLHILVIDDGSTDNTFDRVQDHYDENEQVRVIRQPNSGKASALNRGFKLAMTEIVVAVDADTVLLPDAIGLLASHFTDPRVDAVAGNAKVGNRINLLTRMQAFEYIVAQNLDRRAFELLNCITVVPGAIGAWRRSAVEAAGGYPMRTLAEDADLTISLLRRGGKIVYEENAIALTEAPQSVGQLVKQRFRWTYGMFQTAWHHRGAFSDSLSVGLVAIPNILIFQILLQLLAPLIDLVFVYAVTSMAMHMVVTQTLDVPQHLNFYLYMSAAVLSGNVLLSWVAFRAEPHENKRLIGLVAIQGIFYHQLMYWVTLKAVWSAMRGDAIGWVKLRRMATVFLPSMPYPVPAKAFNLPKVRQRTRPTATIAAE